MSRNNYENQGRRAEGTFKSDAPLDHSRPVKFSLTAAQKDLLEAFAQREGISPNALAKRLVVEAMSRPHDGDPS